jgi:EAL domain-containing protein (putative c-di-GMP-specific phosphodiesterase class I)
VVRLVDQAPVHQEILVRIRDEDGRYILPGNFIELAESLGLVQEVDLRVVEILLRFMERNGQVGRKLRYFVNLSRVSISDQRWIARFMTLLRSSAVNPNQLVFEITETAAMAEVDVTLAFIRRLKDMGCRFALDDFGAGFSSFYYLKRFEVDYLKIDGGFVRDLATDEGNRIFVKAMNDVARGLKKQVIAEWVESPEVLKVLLEMGAEYGQGYLFQRPELLLDFPVSLAASPPISHIA